MTLLILLRTSGTANYHFDFSLYCCKPMCFSQHGHKLTRICLNKMISISLASLAAVKRHCCSLQVLELHVDKVTTAPARVLKLH